MAFRDCGENDLAVRGSGGTVRGSRKKAVSPYEIAEVLAAGRPEEHLSRVDAPVSGVDERAGTAPAFRGHGAVQIGDPHVMVCWTHQSYDFEEIAYPLEARFDACVHVMARRDRISGLALPAYLLGATMLLHRGRRDGRGFVRLALMRHPSSEVAYVVDHFRVHKATMGHAFTPFVTIHSIGPAPPTANTSAGGSLPFGHSIGH
ncbi:hypothetical protein ACIP4W_40050 [Streptomyces sp. NPDC088846]|uniref:hypothetical protein n=1 Tax=Streptomyces sp. NPDC088846 TaxID=3365908 RepID=UPI003824FA77